MKKTRDREACALGMRIREARERLKWSPSELALAAGLGSAEIISSIESGSREGKAAEVVKIATALNTSLDNLMNPELRPEPQFAWRERPADGYEEHETRFLVKCERYGFLEKWCQAITPQRLPALRFTRPCPSFSEVQRQANSVRNHLQLGGRPACSLEKTLEEDYGVKVFYEELGLNRKGGFSVQSWFGTAVLLNSSHAPWRRNYSLARELFHLLTTDQLGECPSELVEELASVFASTLLLPSEQFLAALETRIFDGHVSFDDLVEIARELSVSIDALLWRLVNLDRLDQNAVRDALEGSLLRMIDKADFPGWDRSARLPERYTRLCFLAFHQGRIGLAKLAEFLETSIVELAEQVQETGADIADSEETRIAVASRRRDCPGPSVTSPGAFGEFL
jgi:XRE family transcriptional regulator, fatty acid utilization regulator